MRVQGIRIEIVILALLLALAGFFGAQHLIREYWIGQPLQEELLEMDGVLEVDMVEGREGPVLQIALGPVPNILKTYQKIQETGERLMKNQEFEILLVNKHKDLESIYFQLHYHIYQYLSQNDFLALKDYLERTGRDVGLDSATFFLDDGFLYLQLTAGDSAYYHRIPRDRKEASP